ncbi:NACHT, LRR and PYD domains-containing protein 1b allele 2 [Xenentodon cancila]
MPAGPLVDISLTAGKVEEVYLPHWIDTESTTPDMFTVLHVDACGDSVQQVSEVTPSHVKLVQPTFSPNGVMFRMKLGIPVKVYHDVLIFKTTKEFLTMHLYLVPPDPDLQEKVVTGESSFGSIRIPKPSPDKSLQILEDFLLKSDADAAEISPEKMTLKYKRRIYFEVFLRNVDGDFKLQLQTQKKDRVDEIVWMCTMRKGDYQSLNTDLLQDPHFVDVHRIALIDRVKDTKHILDKLLYMKIISSETYEDLRAQTSVREQMRDILKFVCSAGQTGKEAFYKILKGMKNLRPLMSELETC